MGGPGAATAGVMPSLGGEAEVGMQIEERAARRRQIAEVFRRAPIKHGLKMPSMIRHPNDSHGDSGIPGFSTGRRFRGLKAE